MSATPAHRTTYAPPPHAREQPSGAALERRRRRQHFARLRRDLLEDVVAGFVLTILVISLTAGLGVLALIEVTCALVLVTSYLLERRIRRQRARRQSAPRRVPQAERPIARRREPA